MATNITEGSVTYTLAGTNVSGNDAAGTAWVVSASDTVTAITPAQTTDGSSNVINGAMLNPQRTTDTNPDHGYDERVGNYNALLTDTPSFAVVAGDIIVKTVAHDPHVSREGAFDEISSLHILSEAPTGEYILGSSIGWAGKSTPAYYNIDVDSWYANRTVYDSTGIDFPTYATLIAALGQHHPLYGQLYASYGSGEPIYEAFAPYGFGGAVNNYGRYVAQAMGIALMALTSDVYTESEVKTLARQLIRHGVEWGDPMLYGAAGHDPDGGIHQFFQGVIAFALYMTGRSSEISDIMTQCPGNWDQAFQITSALASTDFVRHTDPDKSAMWRERTLSTQPGGATLRIPCSGSSTTGDWNQIDIPAGAIATRVSDSQTAIVASSVTLALSGTVDVTLTDTSQFVSGDVIYFDAPPGWMDVGNYDWGSKGGYNGISGQPRIYTPASGNGYRNLQAWWGQVMGLRALRIFDPAFRKVQGYLERTETPNEPSASNDYPSLLQSWDGYTAESDQYSAHWAALSTVTQIGSELTTPDLSANSGATTLAQLKTDCDTLNTWGGGGATINTPDLSNPSNGCVSEIAVIYANQVSLNSQIGNAASISAPSGGFVSQFATLGTNNQAIQAATP